jgi:hypothetical protein
MRKVAVQVSPGPPDAPRDNIQEGRKWIGTIFSRFGPVKDRAATITTLDFEKPLLELDKRIKEASAAGTHGASIDAALDSAPIAELVLPIRAAGEGK